MEVQRAKATTTRAMSAVSMGSAPKRTNHPSNSPAPQNTYSPPRINIP